MEELSHRAGSAIGGDSGQVIRDVRPLPGGASSLTYAAVLDDPTPQQIVIKAAPPGLPPVRNRDVLRQARVLEDLASAPGVAVPRVLGTDAGDPPEIPPLFVMEFVHGDSYEPVLHGANPDVSDDEVEARALAAAGMLAALHAAKAPALEEDAADGLLREVERWSKAFSTVGEELRGGELADDVQERRIGSSSCVFAERSGIGVMSNPYGRPRRLIYRE
jgi:aminoglycoside phosphotransferase (APT) family kinase protein